jgi:hypothetical protein
MTNPVKDYQEEIERILIDNYGALGFDVRDYADTSNIEHDEAIDAISALIEQEVRKELEIALNPPKKYHTERMDSCEHEAYIPARLATLEENN